MESEDFINTVNSDIQFYAIDKAHPGIAIAVFKAVDSGDYMSLWGCWIDVETHNSQYSNIEILKTDLNRYSLYSKWPGV